MPVNSKEEMLSVQDIVNTAVNETDTGVEPDIAYAAVIKEFQDPNGVFLRYGNTLFIIHGSQKTPGAGTFRALNADIAENFLQSSYQFVLDAYEKGYYVLVTEFKDQSLINIFRMVSQNPPRQGMGYSVATTSDGEYQVTLTLGPKLNVQGQSPMSGPPEMNAQTGQQINTAPMAPPQGALNQLGGNQTGMGGVR
jgi:hypothetical protein